MIINLTMTSLNKSQQVNQQSIKTSQNDEVAYENPRKAATKLKETNLNIDIMKRRLMVLQGQEDYHRYRTIDHEKRINRHTDIHNKIVKEKEILKKSLQKRNDNTWVKQKCEQIRQQLKHRMKEAKKTLIEEKTDRTHHINEESHDHDNKIKEDILKAYEQNKSKRLMIQDQEDSIRESVSRHISEKIKRVKVNKSIDSGGLTKKADEGQQELSRLVLYEQELIKKNSQSLQASQIMKRKFNEIFPSHPRNNSILPEIKPRALSDNSWSNHLGN